MSLSLIFRLQAAFAAIWALQLILVPGMVFAQYQWGYSAELVAIAQAEQLWQGLRYLHMECQTGQMRIN